MFGRHIRRVRFLAWLTLLPNEGFLPQRSHLAISNNLLGTTEIELLRREALILDYTISVSGWQTMSQMNMPPNRRQFPVGKIEVLPRAIASIVARAAAQTYGVVGMAPHTFREGMAHVLHQRDAHRGVDVRVGDESIEIDVYVIVEYGTRIGEVARNVQDHVRYAVEQALGMPVAHVNVRIQGLKN